MQHQRIHRYIKGGLALFLLLAFCGGSLLLSRQVHAAVQATYYVSPTGSDSNSGTSINAPFATLDHARQVVESINGNMTGDIVVYLLGGTYTVSNTVTFTSNDSGTNGHNIVYAAYPGQTPVLSGGTRITGWTLHDSSKNIWQASIPAGFDARQLYVNGVRARRAQGSALPSGTTQNSTGYVIPNTTLAHLLSPRDLEFVYNGTWVHSRCDVASISSTSTQTTITMDSPCFQIVSTWYWQSIQFPSYLENAYEFLSSPGDWSIDTTHQLISYIPRSGENLTSADVEAGNTQTLIALNGTTNAPVRNLVFQGLTFAYTGWLQPSQGLGFPDAQANLTFPSLDAVQHWTNSQFVTPSGGSTWNGIPYGGSATKMPGAVEAHAALNVQFLSNTFTHLGDAGLDMDGGSQNDAITGNVFTDISGNGLQFGGVRTPNPSSSAQYDGNTTINDNTVNKVDVEYQGGVGMFLGYVDNILVTHNEVSNVPYSGISMGWGWGSLDTLPTFDTGNTISDNYVHDVMQVRQDGGCIYVLGPQPKGSVTGNFCSGSPWHGIYLDQGTTSESVTSNVTEHIGAAWLAPNPNSFDSPGNTANGNYTDDTNYGTRNVTVTNTTVFSDSSVPAAAQAIIANAGLEPAYRQHDSSYAVNAGGAAAGSFTADELYSGGNTYSTTTSIDTSGVSNPAPQAVYQTERYGNFTYTFPNLSPGVQYTVRMHESENYWTSSGQRSFNVSINGQQVLSNFDIYAAAGGANKAIVEQFTTTADATGQITIQFTSVKDNAKVDGIEILASGGGTPTPTPTATATSTPTPTPSPTPGGGTTYYHLVNRNSGMVMDVNGASTSAGANIIQWPNNGGTNQEWSLQPTGDGYYYLVNRNSGLVLDVTGASTAQGTQLIQWSNHGGTNQEWSLVSTGNGYYYLVNRNSGLVADVNGASTAQGATIIQWPNNGGANQQWSLVQV
jgi:hypothetical protein